jgi:hypothetical protein
VSKNATRPCANSGPSGDARQLLDLAVEVRVGLIAPGRTRPLQMARNPEVRVVVLHGLPAGRPVPWPRRSS